MRRIARLTLAMLIPFTMAWCQASVDETAETAFVYVDGTKGSDSNPGNLSLPVKTIGKAASMAVANNWAGIGTRVTIRPGIYRETISLSRNSKDTSAPITFEASTAGTVIVSGADLWAGWTAYGPNPNIFTHPWPYRWGLCPQATTGPHMLDIVRRREMIFVNGIQLTQVPAALSELLEGTFYVDEGHGTVYIWPPAGTNMSTAAVDVAVRPTLLSVLGKNNMVFRGLAFQYANSCHQDDAADFTGGSSNILVDNDKFVWNNSGGLFFHGLASHFTVQNSIANHNGEVGLKSHQVKYGLWSSVDASYNNWRGAQGGFYTWTASGAKFMLTHNSAFQHVSTNFNQSPGIHWDTDNADITVDSVLAAQNLMYAGTLEASQGPTIISNSYFCTSARAFVGYNSSFNIGNSPSLTMTGNTFYNSKGYQVQLIGFVGGRQVTDWETGELYDLFDQNTTFTQNTIVGSGGSLFNGAPLKTDWNTFISSFASDYNTWWNTLGRQSFYIPAAADPLIWQHLKLADWQSLTGQDTHSVWAAPSVDPSVGCKVTPDIPDFWLIAIGNLLSTTQGGSVTFNMAIFPNGFSGRIRLTVDGVGRMGGAYTWSPGNSVTLGGDPVPLTLTVKTGSQTSLGPHTVTVHANSGSLTRTVSVIVSVQ